MPSRADIPAVVVPGKGHRYIVWLDSKAKDGVTVPPLTQADITRYCGAAEGFAQRMWKLTNNRHRIFQVEFDYGSAPMRYDVEWKRFQGTANAGRRSGLFRMFDAITEAVHSWSEAPTVTTPSPNVRESCRADNKLCIRADCPPGLKIVDSTGGIDGGVNRELCVDESGNSPLEPATDAAFTLSHELSHSHYVRGGRPGRVLQSL